VQGERPEHRELMRVMAAELTRHPCDGVERMAADLEGQGGRVHGKRVRRLMRPMGLEASYPKPKVRQAHPDHRVAPSL
jgi:putative transposase